MSDMPQTERGWAERKALSGKKTIEMPDYLTYDDCDMDWVVCYFDLLRSRRCEDIRGHTKAKKIIEDFRASPDKVRKAEAESRKCFLGMAFMTREGLAALRKYAAALSVADTVAPKWKIAA